MQRTYGQKNDTGSEHRERNAYGTSMDKRKMHLVKSWRRKKYAHSEPKNKITIIHLVLYSQCHFTFAKTFTSVKSHKETRGNILYFVSFNKGKAFIS